MSDLNNFSCTGRLGADPELYKFNSGDEVVNMRIAISERWKKDGEKREKTLWLAVKIKSPGLVRVACDYLKKGSMVALSGQLSSRQWEKDGQKHTEIELGVGPFGGSLTLLSGQSGSSGDQERPSQRPQAAQAGGNDDNIPFSAEWRL